MAQQTATVTTVSHPVFQYPDDQSPVITLLPPNTPVMLVGRYQGWLHISYGDGLWQGWMPVLTLASDYDVSLLPVETIAPLDLLNNLTFWNFDPSLREIFRRGQALGNRANVFSKVGDSLTVSAAFMQPFGQGIYNLGLEYAYLKPALDFFQRDSFLATSRAARVGWRASDVLKVDNGRMCEVGDSFLTCEYRVNRPAVALILVGTNDVRGLSLDTYNTHMRQIVEISLAWGVIPVLSTIPPQSEMQDRVLAYNLTLIQIAEDYNVPVWNYWLVMRGLPENGLSTDGIHPSTPPTTTNAAVFTGQNLQYGFTARNLTALQALHLLLYKIILSEG